MHSIKHRMVISFMFIIIITVIILEFFLIHGIRQSYYGSLRDSLFSQLQTATDLYVRYFADATLAENVLNNVDTFWKQIPAQVEIIDMQGQVLMNSRGTITDLTPEMEDVTAALAGRTASWVGQVPYDNEKIMAASAPIMVDNEQIGVLRLLASLREVNHEIRVNAYRYLSFGGLVVIISGLVSLILANTLTEPLKQVTKAAEAMAAGNFQVKSAYRSRDEIGKLSETLNYLAGEIVKKEELKNDFISSVSHELRTPLTSIKGWAITLKEDYENKTFLQGGLNIIEKECDRLTEMVTELLDFSRFVSGKITLKKEKVEITALLAQLKMQLAPRAAREKIEFQVLLPETPLYLFTDGDRLKQVFINLLDNAFKFTAGGGQVILKAETGENFICFSVEDTGSGIAPEELPRVKEKFYKGKSSQAQSGIGLSLSDEIIRLMQGKLEIQSELGQGTCVTVTLPLQEAAVS